MASRMNIVISNLSGKRRALSTAVNMLAVAELYSFTTLSSFFRMADTAEQEAQHKEDLHLVGGRAQVLEDDAGAKVGGRDDMDKTGHYHPVQIKPELLVQEVLSGILNKKMLDVKFL